MPIFGIWIDSVDDIQAGVGCCRIGGIRSQPKFASGIDQAGSEHATRGVDHFSTRWDAQLRIAYSKNRIPLDNDYAVGDGSLSFAHSQFGANNSHYPNCRFVLPSEGCLRPKVKPK